MSGTPTHTYWLEGLLALAIVALLLQFFPGIWRGALSTLDVRHWSWPSHAIASATAIVVLVGIKATQKR